jgi:hypothetical protein
VDGGQRIVFVPQFRLRIRAGDLCAFADPRAGRLGRIFFPGAAGDFAVPAVHLRAGAVGVAGGVMVLSPRMDLKPGIIAYPLKVDRDFEITILANLITLTPGTLSVDVSDDRRILYVHAMDASDPEATKRDIAEGFERKIMEAFR